ncbi:DUF3224 domain-containing protein [Corallococcus sp. CA047B]|uniref:DUF3224 domain-containing protein n=1 Tax=Corallococcus sp. CA047B TaxID=2316729 RepID=UPI000EA1629D|nr:DUF3224 domain-containing protein [Corallococcus sp. CA047B]RKH16043.1 DUF3224 domain-containing protein [Corallococcus sp. CA047B]
MGTPAKIRFSMANWKETAFGEQEGGLKLSQVMCTRGFQGDFEGEGALAYLLDYRADQTCHFMGLERVTGTLLGKKGSFVLKHSGVYAADTATSDWEVVAGSGTGELRGLRGQGGFVAKHGEDVHDMVLDHHFD